jgi:hypothetical protein
MLNYKLAKSLTLIFILSCFFSPTQAQEISANVRVNLSQINNTSLNYLDNLAGEIESYLNDYTWSNDNFQPKERINVSIQINLLGVTDDFTFNADIIIRSMRPIYNSVQQSSLFIYNDESWTFNYTPNRGLVHDELQFDALATLLDFYAYVILGYDYDSFSRLGGSPYFSEAQNLVSLAQTSSARGWERSGSNPRNRAQLISDLLNPNYEVFRRANYIYHRKGLDLFLENPGQARQNIIESLEMIQNAKRQTTSNLLFNTFFNAKYREIVPIFEDAATDIRLKAYNILAEIDQSHLSDYRKLQ